MRMPWSRAGRDDSPEMADPVEAARRFWLRWQELLPRISAALGNATPALVDSELGEAVAAIHPDLHFCLQRGLRAVYALVISGQEAPALRRYTDAWQAVAPPEDALWEYHDSVPPVPDPNAVTVNLGEHRLKLAEVRVSATVNEVKRVVDVEVYHPKLAALDEAGRAAMTFLPLDATLGERAAGQWLGRVRTQLVRPRDAGTLLELREIIGRLAANKVEPS